MSPFTLFFARLTELLGAEISTQLVREFAGQTIQFPVTGHYADSVSRGVTPRITIFFNGVEYDVSHLPEAAVGEVITVSLANLQPVDLNRFASCAGFLRVNNRGDETSPLATDLQDQSSDRAPLGACHRAEAFPLHHLEHSPEGVASPAPCNAQATQLAHETQSEVRPVGPAHVDRS